MDANMLNHPETLEYIRQNEEEIRGNREGEREGNVFNHDTAKVGEQKFFDFSVKYVPNDGDWYVGLYGKNLADDQYIGVWASSSPLQGGSRFGTYTDPRTYSITFGREF